MKKSCDGDMDKAKGGKPAKPAKGKAFPGAAPPFKAKGKKKGK